MILKLISFNIHFIFVLDGKIPPIEKSLEKEMRVLTRQKTKTRIESILDEWFSLQAHMEKHQLQTIESIIFCYLIQIYINI